MQINDNWKVESDALNVILYRRADSKEKSGEEDLDSSGEWCVKGYYGTVAGALSTLLEREILGTGLVSLQVVNARIEAVSQDIYKALGKLRVIPLVGVTPE